MGVMSVCKCGGSGVTVAEVMPGVIVFQTCGCPVAELRKAEAERELRELLGWGEDELSTIKKRRKALESEIRGTAGKDRASKEGA